MKAVLLITFYHITIYALIAITATHFNEEKNKTVTYHEQDCIQPSTGADSSVAASCFRCSFIPNRRLSLVIQMMWNYNAKKCDAGSIMSGSSKNMSEISKHNDYYYSDQ